MSVLTNQTLPTSKKREPKWLFRIIFLGFFVVLARVLLLHYYTFLEDKRFSELSHKYEKMVGFVHPRGLILDRRLEPIAISISKSSIAINPRIFNPDNFEKKTLKKILKISESEFTKIQSKKNYFAWLKRQIGYEEAKKIKDLNIKGLDVVQEQARHYPQGALFSSILGYVGRDNQGLKGVELRYDDFLNPKTPLERASFDAKGFLILKDQIKSNAGVDLVLTLDRVIQENSYEILKKWVQKAKAKSGYVLITDPSSGLILSAINYPSVDYNEGIANHSDVLDISRFQFEPGSIAKPITIAAALEEKKVSPFEMHDCENGEFLVSKNVFIHDDHPKDFLNTKEVLAYSSNICTYKIAMTLGKNKVYDYFKKFLAPVDVGIRLQSGFLKKGSKWSDIEFSNISFGQGFFTNIFEITKIYNIIASGGYLNELYMMEQILGEDHFTLNLNKSQPLRMMSEKNSQVLKDALKLVVEEGTAKNIHIEGFPVAGKTGTSQKFNLKTKKYDLRTASFIGFVPADDPVLTIAVVIDEVGETPAYGGLWAAPAFKEIAESTLNYLKIAPSKVIKPKTQLNLSLEAKK